MLCGDDEGKINICKDDERSESKRDIQLLWYMCKDYALMRDKGWKMFLLNRWRSYLTVVGLVSFGSQVHEIRAAWTDGRNGLSTTNARKSRWTRLRAGQDQDPQVGGAWSHPRSPPFIATPSPSVSDALPKGAVKPSTRSVPVLRLLVGGSAIETTVSRQQLAAELNCPLRDLRVADPTFPGHFPSILARCGAVIFAVSDVKAVIRANELLLFPTTPEVLWIVSDIQEKLMQEEQHPDCARQQVPFEQTAVECCLKYVCQSLGDSVRDLEPRLRTVLDSFKDEKHSLESLLHRLLPLKNEMDELDQSIVEVCKCMHEILLNDEDMSLMYLTDAARNGGVARDPEDHQAIEMLFENYLLQVELLASDLRDFQNEVRNTEEIVEIELDVMRNNIMRFELLLSISAFTVSLGALVTGVFGMNLLSGWELHANTFWIVTGSIYGCMALAVAGTVASCRRSKLL